MRPHPTAPRAAVLGYPVAHARSPVIHGHWLSELGLDGAYDRLEVAPADLPRVLGDLPAQGLVGGNLTIPHKEAGAELCHRLTDRARRMGSVNTLWLEDGRLHGDTTDGLGFVASLDDGAPGWRERTARVLLLGAGGASASIAYALHEVGVDAIVIANRTAERAQRLAERLPAARAWPWAAADELLPTVDLLVNTTAMGMGGTPSPGLSLDRLPAHAVVADIVYVPLETPLLAAARARGLAAVDGLGMLLHQAVPGFERWFGQRPKVTLAVRAAVLASLTSA